MKALSGVGVWMGKDAHSHFFELKNFINSVIYSKFIYYYYSIIKEISGAFLAWNLDGISQQIYKEIVIGKPIII